MTPFRIFMPARCQHGGRGHTPLTADQFPNVASVDAQLKYGGMFAFDRADLNLLGVIHDSPLRSFPGVLSPCTPKIPHL